jgi:transposase
MEWPSQSPDLNIIENAWLKMKTELQKISETVDSRDQLNGKIFQIWTNISVDYIRNLYSSIPKRTYSKFRLLEVTSLNIKVSQSSLYIFYMLSLHDKY